MPAGMKRKSRDEVRMAGCTLAMQPLYLRYLQQSDARAVAAAAHGVHEAAAGVRL